MGSATHARYDLRALVQAYVHARAGEYDGVGAIGQKKMHTTPTCAPTIGEYSRAWSAYSVSASPGTLSRIASMRRFSDYSPRQLTRIWLCEDRGRATWRQGC